MTHVGPHNHKVCLANKEYYEIQFTNKTMRDYISINEDAIDRDEDLEFDI
jgi:hypothetical protein